MKEYEQIQITLNFVLDEQRQKDLDVITEDWRASELDGRQPFKNWTREKCLATTLERGLVYIISNKADNLRFLSQFDNEGQQIK